MMTHTPRWLLLIHQIPPKPNYFRVKIWRRLRRIGAVALKNSVYVLPRIETAQEDLAWVLREIIGGGADATLCEAHMVDGISDEQIESLFQAARDADYAQLGEELRGLLSEPQKTEEEQARLRIEFARIERRLSELLAIDFFDAPGRVTVDGLFQALSERVRDSQGNGIGKEAEEDGAETASLISAHKGRVWVTRKGVHIDRIACAWFIRRFIDEGARFKFVPSKGYEPEAGEVRFDMFDAEFTHEGDLCSFEVFLKRFRTSDAGLSAIAEIIHDIDLKDRKHGREETDGVASLILGIAHLHRDDGNRIARGSDLLDALYAHFVRGQIHAEHTTAGVRMENTQKEEKRKP